MTQGGIPAAGGAPERKPQGKVFLRACPICEEGPVYEGGVTDDAKLYTCRTCKSVLVESIFGFSYKTIDARFGAHRDEYDGQTVTRQEVMQAAEKIYHERVASKPAEKPDKGHKRPQTSEPELFWQVDKEEVERRAKAGEAEQKKKTLTVDDMLDELKRQSQE